MDDLISELIDETTASLAALDDALARRGGNANDSEILTSFSRLVHTIKGACGFLGLTRLEPLAQAVEQMLGRLERREIDATPAANFVMLEALARIKSVVGYLKAHGEEPVGDDRELLAHLRGETKLPSDPPAFAVPDNRALSSPRLTKNISEAARREALHHGLKAEAPTTTSLLRGIVDKLAVAVGELIPARNQLKTMAQQDEKLAASYARLSKVARLLAEILGEVREKTGVALPVDILPVLMVEAGGQMLALPERYIVEIVDLEDGGQRIETISGTRVLLIGKRIIPLVDLASLLELRTQAATQAVVMKVGEAEFGLIPSQIGEIEEIVQSEMPRLLADLGIYRGAAQAYGDTAVLVLDTAGLARAIGYRQVMDIPPEQQPRLMQDKLASFLVFRAGDGAPKALLLNEVARVDEASAAASNLRIAMLPGTQPFARGEVVVLAEQSRGAPVALAVEKVQGVMRAPFALRRHHDNPAYLGTVTIAGKATQLVDVAQLLQREVA